MKLNKITLLAGIFVFVLFACENTLDVSNTNSPTPSVIQDEAGMTRFAKGMYIAFGLNDPSNFLWITSAYHSLMGDELTTPWGNWQYRWVAHVDNITLDDNSVFTPSEGGTQPEEIARVNTRQLADQAALTNEWNSMYYLNNQANILLDALDSENLVFTGNADAKKAGYTAFARFWKGFAYARIASMYDEGLIINSSNETNSDYKTRDELIAESFAQFDLAIASASGVDAVVNDITPEFFLTRPSSASFPKIVNTLKARTLLVNSPKSEVSGDASFWNQIKNLTEAGMDDNSEIITLVADPGYVTYPTGPWYIAEAAFGAFGWHRVSERVIDDIQPGDARLANFDQSLTEAGDPNSWNTRGRGIQYNSSWTINGTRYAAPDGDDASNQFYLTGSVEENLLMLAEAEFELGNNVEAAQHIDAVRTMQGAGLAPIDPNTDDIWTHIYSERRIGLFIRGLAFYDARRTGIILPSGGKSGVTVIEDDGTVNTNATIIYNYLPYWPVPEQELTFNNPGNNGGSTITE